jgi:hypothetical protein
MQPDRLHDGSEPLMSAVFAYREEYLHELVAELRPLFAAIDVELPAVRCSCSFAYRGGQRVLGQCWPAAMAADGVAQIKITPLRDEAVEVAGILVHELIHAARPGVGHRKPFRDIAILIGLIGQMRSTVPGPALTKQLTDLTARLGPYPHARLDPGARLGGSGGDEMQPDDVPAKQTTRLIKVACPACAYPARVTRVWIERMGPPICPCGERMRVDDNNPLARRPQDAPAATGLSGAARVRGPR